jgi:hypothetical protein
MADVMADLQAVAAAVTEKEAERLQGRTCSPTSALAQNTPYAFQSTENKMRISQEESWQV